MLFRSEWFFVFDIPYSTAPAPVLQTDILSTTPPMMWWGTPSLGVELSSYHHLTIIARHPISTGDVWAFSLDSIVQNFVPSSYTLFQNYPNPFNPNTTIMYDLPTASRVRIRIYNILGQEVYTSPDEVHNLGTYSVVWRSISNTGNSVASGVYFYRMEASSLVDPKRSFTQVKKMLVLK